MLCSFLVIIYCTWSLDRGFEITDEAYYLLLAIHADSQMYDLSGQRFITEGIWQVTHSLKGFRMAGMLLLIASSCLLAFGSVVAFSKSRLGYASYGFARNNVIYATSIICALLYATTINFSPCYNLLASAGAYASAGLVLLSLHSSVKWHRLALLLMAGSALGVEFVSKPSAGLATLGVMIVWISLFGLSFWNKLISVVMIISGCTLFTLALFQTQTTNQDFLNMMNQSFELFRMVQVETVGARLERYILELFNFLEGALTSFFVVLLVLVMYMITRRKVFAGIFFLSLVFALVNGKYLIGGTDQIAIQAESTLILFLLVLVVSIPVWKKNYQIIYLAIGLALLPYTVSFGTGNSLFTQSIISLAPWGVLIALIANSDFTNKTDKTMALILLTLFAITITSQIISSGFKVPYHMSSPITEQSQPVYIDGLGSVKVDAETKKFIADLKSAAEACDIEQGTPFLGLYNIPGIALVMEVVPVLAPWLTNKTQAEVILELGSPNILKSSAIAVRLNPDQSTPLMPKQMRDFPKNYQFCGDAIYPFNNQRIQIWKYNL